MPKINVDGHEVEVSREVYERARIKDLEQQLEHQRELNRHGFTEEDQQIYDALNKQFDQ